MPPAGPRCASPPVQKIWQNQYNLRLDQNFSARDTFFARYTLMDQRQTDPTNSPLLGNLPPAAHPRAERRGGVHPHSWARACSTNYGSG